MAASKSFTTADEISGPIPSPGISVTVCTCMERQTGGEREKDKEGDRKVERDTGREADRKGERDTTVQQGRQEKRETETGRERDRQAKGARWKESDKEIESKLAVHQDCVRSHQHKSD